MDSRLGLDGPPEVLLQYPFAGAVRGLGPLGGSGGFSGATLWRIEADFEAPLCLRAWPGDFSAIDRLEQIHRWMVLGRGAGLAYLPAIRTTIAGATWVCHSGRLWEVAQWMPGKADFRAAPSRARLEAACASLALLHRAWERERASASTCPAVERRMRLLVDWQDAVRGGWRPALNSAAIDPVGPWARRGWELLAQRLATLAPRIESWRGHPMTVQPCLCDVWHDNVLFKGDAVSGIVDYGSAKVDHVAVDLARLLGSLVGDDPQWRSWGLAAYTDLRALSPEDTRLVAFLDESGTLLAIANWLLRLYRDGRAYADREAVARRLGELVERVENWGPCGPADG